MIFFIFILFYTESHVKLPPDEMTMEVLRMLNVTPSQLHPNSWAALQAFQLVCKILNLTANTQTFLYFYYTWLGNKVI